MSFLEAKMAFLTDLDNYVLFGSQYDEKMPFLEDYVLFDRPTGKDSYVNWIR